MTQPLLGDFREFAIVALRLSQSYEEILPGRSIDTGPPHLTAINCREGTNCRSDAAPFCLNSRTISARPEVPIRSPQ
jgi:hypothetical protein